MKSNDLEITPEHLDYIKETFNIGVGKGAKILNTMLNSHIQLSVPELEILNCDNQLAEYISNKSDLLASVDLGFKGSLTGLCKLIFPSDSALKLVNEVQGITMESESDGFDAVNESILKEIGNIVLNSVIGNLCNYLEIQLSYSVPVFKENYFNNLIENSIDENDSVILLAKIQFYIETMDVKGDVMTVFNMGSFNELIRLIDKQMES